MNGNERALQTHTEVELCRTNVIPDVRSWPLIPPLDLHGKEGVDGSSPSEGFTKGQHRREGLEEITL
jgi:hypothetical protein